MRVCILLLVVVGVFAERERESDGGAASRLHRHVDGGSEDDNHADHQAVLGSKKKAEEFDDLSPQEAKKRLRVLAKQMDSNVDGFVDPEELTAWVKHSMVTLDEEEVEDRMKEIDLNADELISWEEYMTDSFPEQEVDKLDADDRKLLEEDKMYFAAADQNGDGMLSREELSAFLNPENYQHMHPTLIEVTLWEKDSNKDGAIDVQEFLGEMADNTHSEWHDVEKNRFMAEYDSDGDGLLKGDEIRKWLIPDVTAVADQESNHLLEGADENKDGKLSIDEIVNNHRLFVGSEATNYGEQLHKVSHGEL